MRTRCRKRGAGTHRGGVYSHSQSSSARSRVQRLSIVIKGGSRCNRRYFTRHLLNRRENDKVRVIACRGFARDSLPQAFEDMEVMARGTRTKNYFYQFSMNPEPGNGSRMSNTTGRRILRLSILGLRINRASWLSIRKRDALTGMLPSFVWMRTQGNIRFTYLQKTRSGGARN